MYHPYIDPTTTMKVSCWKVTLNRPCVTTRSASMETKRAGLSVFLLRCPIFLGTVSFLMTSFPVRLARIIATRKRNT